MFIEGALNVGKNTKDMYRFNTMPIKIPMSIFCTNGKTDLCIHMKWQGALNSQSNIIKEK